LAPRHSWFSTNRSDWNITLSAWFPFRSVINCKENLPQVWCQTFNFQLVLWRLVVRLIEPFVFVLCDGSKFSCTLATKIALYLVKQAYLRLHAKKPSIWPLSACLVPPCLALPICLHDFKPEIWRTYDLTHSPTLSLHHSLCQGPKFVQQYAPAFSHYLTQRVGTKFDPAINFTIRFEVRHVCCINFTKKLWNLRHARALSLSPFDGDLAAGQKAQNHFIKAPLRLH
jgi:hypothetical protein